LVVLKRGGLNMPESAERIYQDTRKKRIRTVWGEAAYREVERGLNVEVRRSFKIPSPEVRAIMNRTVEAYLAGEIEPFSSKEVGHRNAQRRMHRYMYQTDHPKKKGRRCWRSAEVPLEKRFISSVFYHTRDEDNEEADWETGEPVKPWVTISACDGSGVRIHAVLNGKPERKELEDTDEELGIEPTRKKKKKRRED
jgi:hypothetical protein